MILGDDPPAGSALPVGGRTTLDDLFRRAVRLRPNGLALSDPPNARAVTGSDPRLLTYSQADRVVTAIAARLRDVGLPVDSIVGTQLPNTAESVLTLLGILRAGMIAAPMPLLWRQAECCRSLRRLEAKAIVTAGRIGKTDHGELALRVAAETFSIRSILGFGPELPDGIVAMDDVFHSKSERIITTDRGGNPASHVALVTWHADREGLVPVARNHTELLAGGLPAALETPVGPEATILTTVALHSFAAAATALIPWLLTGGALALHHPFDPDALAEQCATLGPQIVVMPGPLARRLADVCVADSGERPAAIIGLWHAPERYATTEPWPHGDVAMVDAVALGEIGLVAAPREDGRAAPIPHGPIAVPRGKSESFAVLETACPPGGTLRLRGPMVPRHAFPPHVTQGPWPRLQFASGGYVDTGLPCRPEAGGLLVTGPAEGLVTVGGYRLRFDDLRRSLDDAADGAAIATLPDNLLGNRLAGDARERRTIRRELLADGANPLLVQAFRDRRG